MPWFTLSARHSALSASLIVGFLWGVWHLPLFLIPGSFQSSLSFPGFLLSTLATSVLFSWVFYHARGSVLVAGVFHAATDTSTATLGVLTGEVLLFWMFVGLQVMVAVAVVVIEGPQHLSRGTGATPSQ
jgi:membrane protease YdiL (CAAX protease family)